jgi:hypothetical protein
MSKLTHFGSGLLLGAGLGIIIPELVSIVSVHRDDLTYRAGV